ncbi:MAG: AzlD domain-containing protein [Acutalibacteraceae bacterium]|nr:AzlD domain-containing protein [Acutalibacteraceae bacterium]
MNNFVWYLLTMAGVTYLIRMLPLVLIKKKITNKYVVSFLYYLPYAVLTVMTVPAVFYATGNVWSALVGFIVALLVAYFEKGLMTVALCSCGGVLITELILRYLV